MPNVDRPHNDGTRDTSESFQSGVDEGIDELPWNPQIDIFTAAVEIDPGSSVFHTQSVNQTQAGPTHDTTCLAR